jgi:hypothetical protein
MIKNLFTFAPLLVASVCTLLFMEALVKKPNINFSETALGTQNTSRFAKRDGILIHAQKIEKFPELEAGFTDRYLRNAVLWLGNSQLHAINSAGADAETAVAKAHDMLEEDGLDLIAVSYPNANLQEHLVTLAYMKEQVPEIKFLILPLVFDDFRESGIRDEVKPLLSDISVAQKLKALQCCESLIMSLLSSDSTTLSDSLKRENPSTKTFQEKSEHYLNQALESHWPIWAAREKARGLFFVQLYRLRNTIFGITPQTKRSVIKPLYEANKNALNGILELTQHDEIRVVSYIAPLRTDVEPPYDPAAYVAFKNEVRNLCSQFQNVSFFDFERIVPAEYWGLKNTTSLNTAQEIDFMHFMEPGHQKLANAIVEVFRSMNLENIR